MLGRMMLFDFIKILFNLIIKGRGVSSKYEVGYRR